MNDKTAAKPPQKQPPQELPEGATPAEAPLPETDLETGLTSETAQERLATFGENAISEEKTSPLQRLMRYFWAPIPWMIEAAAILSAALGDWAGFAIIVTMLLVNAAVDFWQERKAGNAIELLKESLALTARVLRDGTWQTLPAKDLVPGDVVLLRIGNVTPADIRLVAGDYLSADEAALTGESMPVDKAVGDAAYSGSVVKLGEMTGVVTATGMNTYFGKTAQLVASAETRSHFQRAVLSIGNFLILTTLVLVAVIVLVAVFRGTPFWETVQFSLILTVAAIPVALPTVLSVTMAVGAEKLARMKAIVSRLVAIEELAGVDVLCVDKTGTLTMNALTVADILPEQGVEASDVVLAAQLASNANDPDPIDKAVLAAEGAAAGAGYVIGDFTPFDPVSKRTMVEATLGDRKIAFSKGAPQVILDLATPPAEIRARIEAEVDRLAEEGYRALGVARREGDVWQFIGLVSIFDPPREDAAATIAETGRMGLAVKMITGDHEAIARQIAAKLGLRRNIRSADTVFADGSDGEVSERIEQADGVARVLPEHKFKIVRALQDRGHIVAMTGDGVNDAPALKQADAGIAVSGATDAARAAADVVLTSSGLGVISSAIEEARRIFERMTSYATFRIAETIRVLVFMSLSILIFDFYPVTAVMIVLLAVLNDFPIMMIAYDNANVAEKPVRWNMPRVLTIASCLGLLGVAETFLLFWYVDTVMHLPREVIQTVIFLKLLVAGHLTLYVTRNQRWFWSRPFPSLKLFLTTEATQILGTLVAVYGIFVTPIGWTYALGVWAYALAWLPIESAIAIALRRALDMKAAHQASHLARTEGRLAGR
ncbi:plasma-membrane proton-efflux P-type ATPase [Afifella marina]|uniref:H+-transporting ATPase n=2 Tax=Hyphomicrobiales TaxID=356 RepID=A0A1G5NBP9_AFIMA|nr:plasma-membrane proton-efflux P-type ATPase [Afifella marina]MBK1623244.1 plasma-membrane proton-efflux P-type ATPase [Afifella marina DSM 2698]MBK1626238.1 plasma-membrane proton-efflux P-type ATPase [Afifella marina]MBK5917116.1 plasma-membrane proton-efflux P-type ATPase [Afifella marina]RAI22220.1 plasma-membrane proton-efflux P-type ATPase [Afifella marina DSM 2698]SCZ34845.1 H+-transporting ATPase [Afifella marina DSM 2698]